MQRSKRTTEAYAECSISFPQKLYALMSKEDGKVIHWASHGFAFTISDQDKFVDEIIPKYFKHTKLTSFQRQLNLYGFRRLAKGDDHGAYFHPKFQRGHKEMVNEIKRMPAKSAMPSLEEVMNAQRQLPALRFNGVKKKAQAQQETPMEVKKPAAPAPAPEVPGLRRAARLRKVADNEASEVNGRTGSYTRSASPSQSYASAHTTEGASSTVDLRSEKASAPPVSKSKITANIGYSRGSAAPVKAVPVAPARYDPQLQSPAPYHCADVPGKCDYLDLPLGSPLFSSDLMEVEHPAVPIFPSDYDCLTVSETHPAVAEYPLASPTTLVPSYAGSHHKYGTTSTIATHPHSHSAAYGYAMDSAAANAGAAMSVTSERWVPQHADAIDDLLDFLGPLPGAQDLLFHCEEVSDCGDADAGMDMCVVRDEAIKG